ncbi:hypothetical protein Geu3261_0185_005 [Komagataeibacter europaeus NBRC 3261]|uniref:Glycosyltransferase n=2 Tax=Komagataeibacter europaeus TaxID=33995 RepID=A0A0D6Q2C7_KOMEU|nr:hypothetical protein Geu3261_0185_005 [Komagataeibacter europaeus NBRC 3261]
MGRKKRPVKTIALYYWRLHDGGTERVTSRLATIYASLGYRVILLTDVDPTPLDYPYDPSIKRIKIPPHRERFVTRGRTLASILRLEKVDVFVSNLWVETATAWDLFVAKSLNIPVIIGWHNVFDAGIYNGHDISFFEQRIAAYKYADLVVALSRMDQYWFSTQGISSRVVHNPLTFSKMPEKVASLSSHVIIWIARVEQHQKRIEHVIRMMPLVLEKVPDAVLLIVGDGPDRERAEDLAEELGISTHVLFAGYSGKVEQYINEAAVHVMTSEFEGSPMVLGEVWAHGVPTVMYDLAFLEYLKSKKGYLSVKQKDYEALAEQVSQVLLDDKLRHRLGSEARQVAQSFFDIDIGKEWKDVFDAIGTADDMTARLSDEEIVSVAPILVEHLAERMYAVDRRHSPPKDTFRPSRPNIKGNTKFVRKLGKLISSTLEKRPGGVFAKLKTIDFAHIGLGDNLMAWTGLHALLLNKVPVVDKNCILYVPTPLVGLAKFIFSQFNLRVEGVAPHTNIDAISPLFSPLPPHGPSMMEWYKTFVGIDWKMNCFEALDLQKTIPRLHFKNTPKTRLRLNLSEHLLHKNKGWQNAQAGYIGYRLWLPVARKLGFMPLPFLVMIKNALGPMREKVRAYVDSCIPPGTYTAPDMAIFPAGKSFQAFPPKICAKLKTQLAPQEPEFYIQANDPWMVGYRAAGIEPCNLKSIEELFWIIKSAHRVLTTDSFSSHVAQFLRDDFILVLTRDFRENIVHPAATPLIVSNHPTCAPCNYHSRDDSHQCLAGYTHCIAFDNDAFLNNIVKALKSFPATSEH